MTAPPGAATSGLSFRSGVTPMEEKSEACMPSGTVRIVEAETPTSIDPLSEALIAS